MNSLLLSHPTKIVNGTIQLPASKSISNRLVIIKAVSGFKEVEIQNLSNANDTRILQNILQNLHQQEINVHDAGTVMRFLTAYLSATNGQWILTGTERMQQRPIGELVNTLRSLGADIEYLKNENYPPLKIKGKKLMGKQLKINGSISSQFISALLLIAPLLSQPLKLHIKNQLVSAPYVNMTLKLMQQWGIQHTWKDNIITVDNKPYQKPKQTIIVENDWSAASYFYSILSLAKKGELTLPGLYKNSLQGDSVCTKLFSNLGIITKYNEGSITLNKTNTTAKTFHYNFINCPDVAQTLAFCCAAKNIPANLTGLQTLSIKETNRISAIKTELEKIKIKTTAAKNTLQIFPSQSPHLTSSFATYNDHRMAMSLAPLALYFNQITIQNPEVVQKSFPHFWEELKKIGFYF